jgi:hypothetical protein
MESEEGGERGVVNGADCPVGKVQVEFVGVSPSERMTEYGYYPVDRAFIEVYVDGVRYRIDVGDFHDGVAQRCGLHIYGPFDMGCEKTSINACSVFKPSAPPAA